MVVIVKLEKATMVLHFLSLCCRCRSRGAALIERTNDERCLTPRGVWCTLSKYNDNAQAHPPRMGVNDTKLSGRRD